MTDILFGNNNRPVLKLLAKRSLKAQKNTIAVLAIMLATLLFTSLFTIAISLQTAMQESNMRTIGTSAHAGIKRLSWDEYELLAADTGIKDIGYHRSGSGTLPQTSTQFRTIIPLTREKCAYL